MGRQRNKPNTKGRILTKSAKWNRGKWTIRYWVESGGYKKAQWAHRELPETTEKLQWTHCKLYQHEKLKTNYQHGKRGNEEYNFWVEEHSRRNQKLASWSIGSSQQASGQGRKKLPKEQDEEKRLRRNKEVLRELEDNTKHNNIHIIGIPEGEEEEQGIEQTSKEGP